MKKFISLFLSLIMITNISTIAVYATEATEFKAGYSSTGSEASDSDSETPAGQDTFQGYQSQYSQYKDVNEATTEVYATRASTFTVKLPKTIILDGKDGTAQYSVQIKGDVVEGDTITIAPNNTEITLNEKSGRTTTAAVNQERDTMTGADINEDWTTFSNGAIIAEDLKAGSWEGAIAFNISIERETDREPEREYKDFEIRATNRAMIGYTDETTDLVIPATFQGEDGTWYKVTSIGYEAFYKCTNLTSVTISEGVTTIGEAAFKLCTNLTSVTIPDSVTYIGVQQSFQGCTSLTSVTIPDSVTYIGMTTFVDCTNLTSVNIPDSVTYIGSQAFWRTGLTSVTIPDSVTNIRNNAFLGVPHIYYNGTATGAPWGANAIN